MPKPAASKPTARHATPSVSAWLGNPQVLPGESAAQYQASLQGLIEELEAKTVLQVYLAEKIHECLWWVRRYEAQKRATIVAEMARIATSGSRTSVSDREALVIKLLNSGESEDLDTLLTMLKGIHHTPESLQQKAMDRESDSLVQLDQQISLQTKILAGLQASYEGVVNRKLLTERLKLQNSLLRRDLEAINLPHAQVLTAASDIPNDQPPP
ncbi:MAG TPA: hypothetical protein PK347_11580 [Burkholderiaceae bacterium]|nr:hypothetical protein [Burkholderiaceae bacterium]